MEHNFFLKTNKYNLYFYNRILPNVFWIEQLNDILNLILWEVISITSPTIIFTMKLSARILNADQTAQQSKLSKGRMRDPIPLQISASINDKKKITL